MTNMKAEKGDLIRIVKDSWDDESHIGNIYEVTHVAERGLTYVDELWNDGSKMAYYEDEYVIHRKTGEEDSGAKAEYPEGTTFSPNGLFPIEPSDAVNPQHYKQGRVEVIDIIEDAVEGADPFEAVCQANVLKYALRYRHKNGVEDLRKSIWYTEKLIAHLDAKSTQD